MSRSTANVASYKVAKANGDSRGRQFRGRSEGRNYEDSNLVICSHFFLNLKMDETSVKQIFTASLPCICCLYRFLWKKIQVNQCLCNNEEGVQTFNIVRNCFGSFEFMEG